jgi:hypothetical protein
VLNQSVAVHGLPGERLEHHHLQGPRKQIAP